MIIDTERTMQNILFDKKVRGKSKGKWWKTMYFYYEDENISFKEKLYTYLYNQKKTGLTTQGEIEWYFRMYEANHSTLLELEKEFNTDYASYLNATA